MYIFSGGVARLRPIPYGEANGTIWLSKVDCKGHEAELADCKHEKWGEKGDCTHKDDVGIECTVTVTQSTYLVGMIACFTVGLLHYCRFGIFREDFIFAKLRICEVSRK